MTDPAGRASCSFERCSTSMIERVVAATVEQTCAHADIPIALLDALEFPLGEAIAAVAELGVSDVVIEVAGGHLEVSIHLRTPVEDPLATLGESVDVITSFFDVSWLDGSAGLTLTGALG